MGEVSHRRHDQYFAINRPWSRFDHYLLHSFSRILVCLQNPTRVVGQTTGGFHHPAEAATAPTSRRCQQSPRHGLRPRPHHRLPPSPPPSERRFCRGGANASFWAQALCCNGCVHDARAHGTHSHSLAHARARTHTCLRSHALALTHACALRRSPSLALTRARALSLHPSEQRGFSLFYSNLHSR